MSDHERLERAAKAAGMSTEQFAKCVRNIIRRKKCRDTNRKIFTTDVLNAIS